MKRQVKPEVDGTTDDPRNRAAEPVRDRWMARGCRTLFVLLMWLPVSCNPQLQESENLEVNNKNPKNPYVRFSEAVAPLEPLASESAISDRVEAQFARKENGAIPLPPVVPLEVDGDLALAGATSIDPLNERIYRRFIREGYAGTIDLNEMDSTSAIRGLCQKGTFDLVTVTRPMMEGERIACEEGGRQPIELEIAQDALAIAVNQLDAFVKNVSLSELADVISVSKWSEANPDWPNEPIKRFAIGPKSPSVDLMVERVFEGNAEAVLNAPNTSFFQFNAPLIQELSTARYGVGFLNYSAYRQAARAFRLVSVEGVAIGRGTVENGTYPLTRKLYLYADANQLKQKPQAIALIHFYLAHVNEEIEDVGLFPLSLSDIDRARRNWLEAIE
ncbi:substrate-binding domain-containing protein [Oscillatoriales cyanobacterium LEGE 11467]|uniref:Substrate-binding domain-containing protein n=1 Tax=Zarconia navalis LEGE 11467 TaxID=1828826 RepID=A0A928VYH1_9CYAN|nr:substrate-binding domain-containing protein [Zarconia navalis]MBE9041132.1 substrate-binding domain-containing protein [Zarconia navalis LEGE 11467]